MSKKYKVDLFEVLKNVNKNNTQYFNRLSEEDQKNLSAYVLQRWVYGAKENKTIHTILTDKYVNPFVFHLQSHPLLLYKLVCAANGGFDETYYQFQKPVKKTTSDVVDLIIKHYHCDENKANDIMCLLDENDIRELRELYDE